MNLEPRQVDNILKYTYERDKFYVIYIDGKKINCRQLAYRNIGSAKTGLNRILRSAVLIEARKNNTQFPTRFDLTHYVRSLMEYLINSGRLEFKEI